jgi:excisionase family DNA binding protein
MKKTSGSENETNNFHQFDTQSARICQSGFEPLLDSTEAAALLKIHPKTLQKMARKGEMAAIQIGRLWRFRASTLNNWLEKIAG